MKRAWILLMLAMPALAPGDPLDASLPENAIQLEKRIAEALQRLPEETHGAPAGTARGLAVELGALKRHARQLRYRVQPGPGGGMPGTFMPRGLGTAPLTVGPGGTTIRSDHPDEAIDGTRPRRPGSTGGAAPVDETARREFCRLVERARRIEGTLEAIDAPGLRALWEDEITPLLRAIDDQLTGVTPCAGDTRTL